MNNYTFNADPVRNSISLLEWYLMTRHITPCPRCGEFLTSLNLCPSCGVRFELVELKANSVTVINGGKRVITRNVLDNLASEAEAESWDCMDLPAEWQDRASSQLTMRPADGAETCNLYGCSNPAVVKVCAEHYVPTCPVCKQPYEGYGICINCAGDV